MYIDNNSNIIPDDITGLENYKFVIQSGIINVYHNVSYNTPINRKDTKGWLCCSEGWKLKNDGKYHETVNCGFMPDRVVNSIDDIFNCYRNI